MPSSKCNDTDDALGHIAEYEAEMLGKIEERDKRIAELEAEVESQEEVVSEREEEVETLKARIAELEEEADDA